MKSLGFYAGACIVIISAIAFVSWALTGPAARDAILGSAVLAIVVQLIAFSVARAMQPGKLMLGWGLGSLLRLIVLVLYAIAVARLWRPSLAPALLSFTAFLFVTTIVEPIFLKR